MQIANGILILSLEHHQHKYGVTPAELLLLHHMHRVNANGSPLGDWFVQKGEAVTVDQEGKVAEEEYFNPNAGKIIPAKAAVPAVTHKRTNAEEIARLRKRYTGNITRDGVAKPAFEAVFGSGAGLKLPQTFEEIEEEVGIRFHDQPAEGDAVATREVHQRREDLLRLSRPDVAAIALGNKIKVHAQDTKEVIIGKIIEVEEAAEEKSKAQGAESKGEEQN